MIKKYPDKSAKRLQMAKALLIALLICFLFEPIGLYFSFFLALFIPIILSLEEGVQLDLTKQMYRAYRKRFHFYKGEWLSLAKFKSVVIKRVDGIQRLYRPITGSHISNKTEVFDVYLMNEHHRDSLYIKGFKNANQATAFAQELSEDLQFPIEQYNPKRGPRRR